MEEEVEAEVAEVEESPMGECRDDRTERDSI